MGILQEYSYAFINWSVGLTVLAVGAASQFSGASTILALPITAITITISALCGATVNPTDSTYKKRKFSDILDFFYIWLEILEILSVTAICARVASATIDYISGERLREWFLGIESHSLTEPWPDVVGVSVIIVITALFMLGLEKSPPFSILLMMAVGITYIFFIVVGNLHIVISLETWKEDFRKNSIQSILTAATLCSYGFVNTYPKINQHKTLKISIMVFIPLLLYSSTTLVFTLMSHSKELSGSSTPLLRVFELRDVDWARLVMAICIICIVCLALTEIMPTLYSLFVVLAGKEWQIFLGSMQYKNSFTGAPMLAIFASGSLAAILAFACPLYYLIKIVNLSSLIKCTIKAFQVLYNQYKPQSNESYLVSTNTQYTKLKSAPKFPKNGDLRSKRKILKLVPFLKSNGLSPGPSSNRNRNKGPGHVEDDEYLLLDDYCDKTNNQQLDDSSGESDVEKESVLSSDIEESCSSTDIDAIVQEYKDKIQIATIDNFNENRRASIKTAFVVSIFLAILIISAVCFAQMLYMNMFDLAWAFLSIGLFSMIVILLMPKNSAILLNDLVPKSLIPILAMFSIKLNIVLITTVISDIWPGILFWICAGGLLLWRCDCCSCEDLLQKNRVIITENLTEYSDKYSSETILIAR